MDSRKLPSAFIFGSGSTGMQILPLAKAEYNILGFLDNNEQKWGKSIEEYVIFAPKTVNEMKSDYILIGSIDKDKIISQLESMDVQRHKIITKFVEILTKPKIIFLEHFAVMRKGIEGSVAEGGVFQGDFAKEINRVFPNKKLYLFDTFEGFNEKDIVIEKQNNFSQFDAKHFCTTNEQLVLAKLLYPQKVVIYKGYFPETAQGIEDKFCFVNLDFDLYAPILAGLNFFYDKMVNNGVILVHDYFNDNYKGVREAVSDFEKMRGKPLSMLPIGDGFSVAILVYLP